jgi:hypothetical protein
MSGFQEHVQSAGHSHSTLLPIVYLGIAFIIVFQMLRWLLSYVLWNYSLDVTARPRGRRRERSRSGRRKRHRKHHSSSEDEEDEDEDLYY